MGAPKVLPFEITVTTPDQHSVGAFMAASNAMADEAMHCGLAGWEVSGVLCAALADAYANLADYAARDAIDWFAILAEVAPHVKFSAFDEAARRRGYVIDMRPRPTAARSLRETPDDG